MVTERKVPMKVDILNQRQISVLLSTEDMKELEIDPNSLHEGSSATAELLWNILNLAGERVHLKAPPRGEIYIDIELNEVGSCRMVFTLPKNSLTRRSSLKKGLVAPIIFHFECLDNLLDLRNVLIAEGVQGIKSDLFVLNGCYRLVLYQPFKIHRQIPLFLQFASSLKGSVNVAYTREHWSLVTASDALEKMLRHA